MKISRLRKILIATTVRGAPIVMAGQKKSNGAIYRYARQTQSEVAACRI